MSVTPKPTGKTSGGNHLYSMPIQGQIGDVHVSTAGGSGGVGEVQVAADEQAIHRYGDGESGGVEGMDEDHEREHDGELPSDSAHFGDPHAAIAPQVGGNQLTLSFQGEVYVFDSVSPEKVKTLSILSKFAVDMY